MYDTNLHLLWVQKNSERMRRGEWMYSSGGRMKEQMGMRVHVAKYIDRIENKKEVLKLVRLTANESPYFN